MIEDKLNKCMSGVKYPEFITRLSTINHDCKLEEQRNDDIKEMESLNKRMPINLTL